MRWARRGIAAGHAALLMAAAIAHSGAADGADRPSANRPASVETVHFADPHQSPVRVVRGLPSAASPGAVPERREVLSFGRGGTERVTVIRGPGAPPRTPSPAMRTRSETVRFAAPGLAPVTIVRGIVAPLTATLDLFGPADGGELDRIAFAVDGVESRHGADLRMWRPQLDGPQGPMQVSAAAALDVGGGDRFDPQQNRLLGRAYLAQMFRRYGNWADALAAYNWGPANVDQWIAGGHRLDRLPPGVAWYVARVLKDALLPAAGL
jgi:transglycosylase-like protein with SLT domain